MFYHGFGRGMMYGGPSLWSIAIFILICWLGYQLYKDHMSRKNMVVREQVNISSEALKILEKRFARGEIDSVEFEERRDLLNKK